MPVRRNIRIPSKHFKGLQYRKRLQEFAIMEDNYDILISDCTPRFRYNRLTMIITTQLYCFRINLTSYVIIFMI